MGGNAGARAVGMRKQRGLGAEARIFEGAHLGLMGDAVRVRRFVRHHDLGTISDLP